MSSSLPIYQPKQPFRTTWVAVRGLQHRVLRWGRAGGRPVWLLHGWMDCAATFQFLVDALPESMLDCELIAPDWRGFGQSQWSTGGYWFPDYLADLEALITALGGTGPQVLVGHSMGGIISCLYAGVRPERVSHCISLEGFGLADAPASDAPARYRRWLEQVQTSEPLRTLPSLDEVAQRMCKHNRRLGIGRAAWLAAELAVVDGAAVRYLGDPAHKWPNPTLYRLEEAKACWRAVTARVLWLAGNEQKILEWMKETPQKFAERQACFAHFAYQVLPECGHNLHHDAPEQLASILADFILGNG